MLPIATLPVAAILLRVGQPDLLDIAFMAEAGNAVFSHLPLLFAMGIAAGLSEDDAGAAVMAGAIGYFVLTAAAKTINADIDMSFFGGIIAGIIAGHSYNKFHRVQLPQYLAFFGGKRLVPIMTGLIALAASVIAGFVWPAIQSGINAFASSVADSGYIGLFVYGVLNRGLIPVGLHHVVNSIFWFGLGEYTNAAGEIVNGDLPRFFAGDPTAGAFMAGFYPVMMFGLPAAALAMYLAAPREESRKSGWIVVFGWTDSFPYRRH
ncbi:PTS transporter subunit EIIC [Endozoicomonas gorgoniicola]|uniref:PTS transporter subunit EIIC n=1 Tax=Endozoicomonas gorgoniicola TaxID=1234144 RepID=A0ABT3MPH3_9GAMM|nr:PTS transporter subunit EIIC [Endozoicomonas gorgoniicola]MCW7551251.1 PTS transporter subunit EIIC [Endozoicomonas gorgoniicola]